MRSRGGFVQKQNGKWLILGNLQKNRTTPWMPVDGPVFSWMATFGTVKKSSLGQIQDFPSLTVGVRFGVKYFETEP